MIFLLNASNWNWVVAPPYIDYMQSEGKKFTFPMLPLGGVIQREQLAISGYRHGM